MAPQLEGGSQFQSPAADILESEFILVDFLHEMDALDDLQSLDLSCFPSELKIDEDHLGQKPPPSTDSKQSEYVPKPASKKRRSTSWLRRKQELQGLRNESKHLEAFLQRKRARNAVQPRSNTLTENQALWKSVAEIARRECQNAKDENLRLRSELHMYNQGFERLQEQLAAAELHQQQEMFAKTFRVGMIASQRLCFDDSSIYGLLERRIDARFHEIDSIICKTRHPTGERFTENVQIWREDACNTAVEFRHVRLLPFGEDATANRIWEIINLKRSSTYVARNTSDMVALIDHHTVPLGNMASVSVHTHTVIKRFSVAAGMVGLVESRSEWSIDHPTAPGSRYRMDEGGWFEVHELPCGLPNKGAPRASQLLTSIKLRPKDPQKDNERSFLPSTVVDIVIPSFCDIMSSHLQSVENYLVDSSVRSLCT